MPVQGIEPCGTIVVRGFTDPAASIAGYTGLFFCTLAPYLPAQDLPQKGPFFPKFLLCLS